MTTADRDKCCEDAVLEGGGGADLEHDGGDDDWLEHRDGHGVLDAVPEGYGGAGEHHDGHGFLGAIPSGDGGADLECNNDYEDRVEFYDGLSVLDTFLEGSGGADLERNDSEEGRPECYDGHGVFDALGEGGGGAGPEHVGGNDGRLEHCDGPGVVNAVPEGDDGTGNLAYDGGVGGRLGHDHGHGIFGTVLEGDGGSDLGHADLHLQAAILASLVDVPVSDCNDGWSMDGEEGDPELRSALLLSLGGCAAGRPDEEAAHYCGRDDEHVGSNADLPQAIRDTRASSNADGDLSLGCPVDVEAGGGADDHPCELPGTGHRPAAPGHLRELPGTRHLEPADAGGAHSDDGLRTAGGLATGCAARPLAWRLQAAGFDLGGGGDEPAPGPDAAQALRGLCLGPPGVRAEGPRRAWRFVCCGRVYQTGPGRAPHEDCGQELAGGVAGPGPAQPPLGLGRVRRRRTDSPGAV